MSTDAPTQASTWTPLREPLFRSIWIAAVASNIGTWMQNVGAAWLMTSLAPSPFMVALVQAATTLPVFLESIDLTPSEHWPEPIFPTEPEPDAGPVLIMVEYTVDPGRAQNFVLAMRAVRKQRLRDGAYRWGLYNDAAAPSRFVETFVVESWAEHLRQHGRVTVADRDVEEVARAFHVGSHPPVISLLIYARPAAAIT